ncbi:hypothetical protein ACLOJK_008786 [Asimina triloba]
MPAVQRLYNVCKELFSKNAASEEAVENVRALLEKIKPSDVGLEQEAQLARGWNVSTNGINGKKGQNGSNQCLGPIKTGVTAWMGIFCLPPSAVIPLHNHPGMTVLSKLLYGTVHVKSYDWLDSATSVDLSQEKKLKLKHDKELIGTMCNPHLGVILMVLHGHP